MGCEGTEGGRILSGQRSTPFLSSFAQTLRPMRSLAPFGLFLLVHAAGAKLVPAGGHMGL